MQQNNETRTTSLHSKTWHHEEGILSTRIYTEYFDNYVVGPSKMQKMDIFRFFGANAPKKKVQVFHYYGATPKLDDFYDLDQQRMIIPKNFVWACSSMIIAFVLNLCFRYFSLSAKDFCGWKGGTRES